MKQYTSLLYILLFTLSTYAQTSLTGYVYEQSTHLPIIGATIYLPDIKMGVATDDSGRYTLTNIPVGRHLIEVKAIGYTTAIVTLDIASTLTYSFTLSQLAGELHEVVVTGMSRGTDIHTNPLSIAVLDGEALRQSAATNVIEVVTKLPGFSALSTGPNISKPIIRGLGYNRVLTLYDGQRQEGQQWGDEHGIEVDRYHIDRVEIIKGPASLAYGSDALAGVVHLLPPRPAPEGTMATEFTTDYATNNGAVGISGLVTGTKDGVDWILRGSHSMAMPYQNKYDGRVLGTAYRWSAGEASLGTHGKWGYTHLNFTLYDNEQEVPDGSRDSATRQFTRQITEVDTSRSIITSHDLSTYHIATIHQRVQHYRLYLNSRVYLGEHGGNLDLTIGGQYSHRSEFSHPAAADTAGLDLNLHTLNYEVKYQTLEHRIWNLSIGVNGMYQSNSVLGGTDFVIPSYRLIDVGPFAIVRVHTGQWNILAGLRYDIRHIEADRLYTATNPNSGFNHGYIDSVAGSSRVFSDQRTAFQGFTASAGVSYQAAHHFTFKCNIARGYRSPSISELSANGVHPGTGFYQQAADHIQPEYSLQPDIGIDYHSRYVAFSLDLFYNYVQHYLYNTKLQASASGDSMIGGYTVFQFTAGNAQLYGGEATIDIHPIHPLHIAANVSVVMADLLNSRADSVRYLPTIPPVHGNAEVRYEWGVKKAHLVNCYARVGIDYFAAQHRIYSAYNTETATSGYVLLDMGMGIGIANHKGKEVLVLQVIATNLLDAAYQNHLSRLKYMDNYPINYTGHSGIYGMGRSVQFSLRIPLSIKI